jgi:hypothetical protein
MLKKYGIVFTSGDPRTYTGLSPTFLTFSAIDGTSVAVPAINESLASSGMYNFDATLLPNVPIYFLADGTASAPSSSRYIAGILDPSDAIDLQTTELGTTLAAENLTLVAIGTTGVALGVTNTAINVTILAQGAALGVTNQAIGSSLVALGTTNVAIGTSNAAINVSILAQGTALDLKIGSTASVFGDSATDPVDIYGYLKRALEFNEGDATFNKDTGVWTSTDRAGLTTIAAKTLANTVDEVTKT